MEHSLKVSFLSTRPSPKPTSNAFSTIWSLNGSHFQDLVCYRPMAALEKFVSFAQFAQSVGKLCFNSCDNAVIALSP